MYDIAQVKGLAKRADGIIESLVTDAPAKPQTSGNPQPSSATALVASDAPNSASASVAAGVPPEKTAVARFEEVKGLYQQRQRLPNI